MSLGIRHVASLMVEHHIKRVLGLENNRLVGFITMDDLMTALFDQMDQ